MTKLALILLPVMAWVVAPVLCFPDGAPISSCGLLFPKHSGIGQQAGSSPYIITVSAATYTPGVILQVNLTSITRMTPFTGFVINARRVDGDTEELVGQFLNVNEDYSIAYSWYPETDGAVNCLTHATNTPQTTIDLSWKTDVNVGDIVFSAAFVQDFKTFWTGVNSNVIKADGTATKQEYSAEAEIFTYPSTEIREVTVGCGDTKGCFLYPHFCGSVKCSYAVSYRAVDADHVQFEIFGESSGYVSLGFSKDTKMGDDLTLTCYMKDGVGSIQFGYNPELYNIKHRATEISKVRVSSEDGFIYCSFVVPKTMKLDHMQHKHKADGSHFVPPQYEKVEKTMNLDQENYLFLAVGDVYQGTSDVPKKHVILPIVSSKPVKVAEPNGTETVYGNGLSPYVKSHAILGIIAWFFLAICGMIISRHFRWELAKICCGSAVWFQMHRFIMSLVLLCSIAAITIIFYGTGKFTTTSFVHAICGLVAIGLCVLQVFAGFLRPDQKSKRRPMFTRLHKFGSFLIYVMAGVTLILAPLSSIIHPGLRYRLMCILVTGLVLYGIWEISFEIMRYCICTFEEPDTEKNHRDRIHAVKIVWFFSFMIFSLVLTIFAAVYIGFA